MGGSSRTNVNDFYPRVYIELSGGKVFYAVRYRSHLPAFGIFETREEADQCILDITGTSINAP